MTWKEKLEHLISVVERASDEDLRKYSVLRLAAKDETFNRMGLSTGFQGSIQYEEQVRPKCTNMHYGSGAGTKFFFLTWRQYIHVFESNDISREGTISRIQELIEDPDKYIIRSGW